MNEGDNEKLRKIIQESEFDFKIAESDESITQFLWFQIYRIVSDTPGYLEQKRKKMMTSPGCEREKYCFTPNGLQIIHQQLAMPSACAWAVMRSGTTACVGTATTSFVKETATRNYDSFNSQDAITIHFIQSIFSK